MPRFIVNRRSQTRSRPFDLPPVEKLKKFYRHVMENYPDRVVTDVYEVEVNSKSSFAPSPSPPFGFQVKVILAHETDFSFDFLVNPTGQRKAVSSAKLPKQCTSATFYSWTDIEYVRYVVLEELKRAMVAPSLRQQMTEMAINTAQGYFKSRPTEHNSVAISLSARISLRFDFEEPIMPRFWEDYCGAFKEYTVSHEIDSKTCSICLDDFISDRQSVSAPCGHKFHRDCINRWLAQGWGVKSRFRPYCRKPINKPRLVL